MATKTIRITREKFREMIAPTDARFTELTRRNETLVKLVKLQREKEAITEQILKLYEDFASK